MIYSACIIHAAEGDFAWAWGFGQPGQNLADIGYDVFVDSTGNVYTTGSFQGTVDFDPGSVTFNLTSNGAHDIYISKLDSSGNLVWARAMGGNLRDGGSSIFVDSSGNVYTIGSSRSSVDFDPGPGTQRLPQVSKNLTVSGVCWPISSGCFTVFAPGFGHPIAQSVATQRIIFVARHLHWSRVSGGILNEFPLSEPPYNPA